MADYKMRVGADNFDRTEYSANAESHSTFVITISNDSKEKLIDGEEFTQTIELNDNEFNLWVKQKTDLKGWRISIVVNSGTTILVGKIIGVVIEPLESGVERTTANCLMSNGSYLSLVVDNTNGTLEGTLSSVGKIGSGVEIPEPTPADTGKFLGVDNTGAYELQNVKTYNRIVKELTTSGGSATFTATSDEWVSGMNNDNTLLEVHDLATSTYYTLWLTDFDATTLTFTGITNTDKLIATIVKSGSDYSGTFNVSALPTGTQVVELTSSSGTLTDEQYAILSGDNAILKFLGSYFRKCYEDSSLIQYERMQKGTSEFSVNYCNITKSNKKYDANLVNIVPKVSANPTLTGTEAELLGLKIGGTSYKAQSLSQTDGIKCAYATPSDFTIADSYSSYNRCGNILTFVLAFSITKNNATTSSTSVATFSSIPANIFTKLVPTTVGANDYLEQGVLNAFSDTYASVAVPVALSKGVNSDITLAIDPTNLVVGTTYHLRYFVSFLMTDNLTKIDPILDNNSWNDINSVFLAGDASAYWDIGDTKSDLGSDGNTRVWQWVHANLYGKHGVFQQVGLDSDTIQWNTSSNVDGDNAYNDYNISDMRNTHLPAKLSALSSELQAIITPTTIQTATNGINGTLVSTSDKLFLPAAKEMSSSPSYSKTEENSALTTWTYWTTHTQASDRIKYDPTNTARYYRLRSPHSGNSHIVVYVNNCGSFDFNVAYGSNRVSLCFTL